MRLRKSMDAFDKKFGYYDQRRREWTLHADWLSLFNGFPYFGFIAGPQVTSGRSICC